MTKNKDGFEPGQLVEFDELVRHLNKPREVAEPDAPVVKRKSAKRKAD